MSAARLPAPLPQSPHGGAKRAADEMALVALAADAQAVAEADAMIDELMESGTVSEAVGQFMQRCLMREGESILDEATELDADTPAALNAKGMIARHLLRSALQGNASAPEEGERFMWSMVLDLTGSDC